MHAPPPEIQALLDLGHRIIRKADPCLLRYLVACIGLIHAEAKMELHHHRGKKEAPRAPERNIKPAEAAARLGISVRKLTRERFTTYADVCLPLPGQTRGYVVSERALDGRLERDRRR